MYKDFMGQSEKRYSLVKAFAVTFWATFGKLGLLFISTSGHTGREQKKLVILLDKQ